MTANEVKEYHNRIWAVGNTKITSLCIIRMPSFLDSFMINARIKKDDNPKYIKYDFEVNQFLKELG